MINNVIQNGPYINIGRMVAFAHAKTEDGVNSLGMSLLHLKEPISLVDKQHPIKLVFVLAAVDQESHVNAMAELAALLRDEEKLDRLLDAKNFEEIAQIIRSVENS
jgi:mannitol/fructose-specific phosphotransferase system IIA component (Ntr-type)